MCALDTYNNPVFRYFPGEPDTELYTILENAERAIFYDLFFAVKPFLGDLV